MVDEIGPELMVSEMRMRISHDGVYDDDDENDDDDNAVSHCMMRKRTQWNHTKMRCKEIETGTGTGTDLRNDGETDPESCT